MLNNTLPNLKHGSPQTSLIKSAKAQKFCGTIWTVQFLVVEFVDHVFLKIIQSHKNIKKLTVRWHPGGLLYITKPGPLFFIYSTCFYTWNFSKSYLGKLTQTPLPKKKKTQIILQPYNKNPAKSRTFQKPQAAGNELISKVMALDHAKILHLVAA